MKHDTLVRDLHPHHAKVAGRTCTYRETAPSETHKILLKTFFADVKGFLNATSNEEKAEKLADLYEVCEHLMSYYGIPVQQVHMIKEKKKIELGSFDQKLILEEETVLEIT